MKDASPLSPALTVLKGRYVLAVSGGVDSMVLLDLLCRQPDIELVVAHFDHGIRRDSYQDKKLVSAVAKEKGLEYTVGHGNLGPQASEETARAARYEFLRAVSKKHKAKAIITAHHQDDLLETAILNLLRGSGRRGLTSIMQNPDIIRPLLSVSKNEIIRYARKHKLIWREDPSNLDMRYKRNYIRLRLIPKMTVRERQDMLRAIDRLVTLNPKIDKELANLSKAIYSRGIIDRGLFIMIPLSVARELVASWLRDKGCKDIDKKTIERLTLMLKTARPGTIHTVDAHNRLAISKDEARFVETGD